MAAIAARSHGVVDVNRRNGRLSGREDVTATEMGRHTDPPSFWTWTARTSLDDFVGAQEERLGHAAVDLAGE